MGNIYSSFYFKCPFCGSLDKKKIGKPKDKIYKCKKCGTKTHFGKVVKKP